MDHRSQEGGDPPGPARQGHRDAAQGRQDPGLMPSALTLLHGIPFPRLDISLTAVAWRDPQLRNSPSGCICCQRRHRRCPPGGTSWIHIHTIESLCDSRLSGHSVAPWRHLVFARALRQALDGDARHQEGLTKGNPDAGHDRIVHLRLDPGLHARPLHPLGDADTLHFGWGALIGFIVWIGFFAAPNLPQGIYEIVPSSCSPSTTATGWSDCRSSAAARHLALI